MAPSPLWESCPLNSLCAFQGVCSIAVAQSDVNCSSQRFLQQFPTEMSAEVFGTKSIKPLLFINVKWYNPNVTKEFRCEITELLAVVHNM